MSKYDPHWAISKTALMDGHSSNEPIHPERFRDEQSLKFVLHTPREREHYISQLTDLIGDDSSTLKSRAELVQLRSELLRTDAQLKALRR